MFLCCQSHKIYLVSFVLNLYIAFTGESFLFQVWLELGESVIAHFSLCCVHPNVHAGMLSPDVLETAPAWALLWGEICVCIYVCVRCWYAVALPSSAVNSSLSRFLEELYVLTDRDPVSWWSVPMADLFATAQSGELLKATHTHTHIGSVKKL